MNENGKDYEEMEKIWRMINKKDFLIMQSRLMLFNRVSNEFNLN